MLFLRIFLLWFDPTLHMKINFWPRKTIALVYFQSIWFPAFIWWSFHLCSPNCNLRLVSSLQATWFSQNVSKNFPPPHPKQNNFEILFMLSLALGIVYGKLISLFIPSSSDGKAVACSAGNPSLIPGSGSSLGERIGYPIQYSWASLVAQTVKNPPTIQETGIRSLGWEDSLEKGVATLSSILAG